MADRRQRRADRRTVGGRRQRIPRFAFVQILCDQTRRLHPSLLGQQLLGLLELSATTCPSAADQSGIGTYSGISANAGSDAGIGSTQESAPKQESTPTQESAPSSRSSAFTGIRAHAGIRATGRLGRLVMSDRSTTTGSARDASSLGKTPPIVSPAARERLGEARWETWSTSVVLRLADPRGLTARAHRGRT